MDDETAKKAKENEQTVCYSIKQPEIFLYIEMKIFYQPGKRKK